MDAVDSEAYAGERMMDTPTVQSILSKLDRIQMPMYEILQDLFECGAITISQRFQIMPNAEKEKRYQAIMRRYDENAREKLAEAFADVYVLLSSQVENGFGDYLGELYMQSGTSNSRSGQFFTPYHVSLACAEATVSEDMLKPHMENDTILTANEPACGSAGMIIALVDILHNKYHFNYARNLFVECSDIESRCVHMAYLQLALAGVPAVVYRRDTLTMKTYERWDTPALIAQWMRFRRCVNVR